MRRRSLGRRRRWPCQPICGGIVLLSVGVDLCEGVHGLFSPAVAVVGAGGDILEDFDGVEFGGEWEAFDAVGEFGDGFVVGEGGDGVGSGVVLFMIVAGVVAEDVSVGGHGLDAELLVEESGEFPLFFLGVFGRCCGGLMEGPAPALAIGEGGVPAFGGGVEDGLALVVDGRAAVGGPTVPAIPTASAAVIAGGTVFVVGELCEVGEGLEAPGVGALLALEEHGGEFVVEFGGLWIGVFLLGEESGGVLHELRARANAVAVEAGDPFSVGAHATSASVSAGECSGDDAAVVVDVAVGASGLPEESPVGVVGGDDFFAEVVEFVDASEVAECVDAELEVVGELVGSGGGSDQGGEAVVGVFVVAFDLGFAECGGGSGGVGGVGGGEEECGGEEGEGDAEVQGSEHELVLPGSGERVEGLMRERGGGSWNFGIFDNSTALRRRKSFWRCGFLGMGFFSVFSPWRRCGRGDGLR